MTATWRDDLDALEFLPAGRAGQCLVHRLAFRALLPDAATPQSCTAYFNENRQAFEAAAAAKAARAGLADEARFHLTSRDIAEAIGARAAPPV